METAHHVDVTPAKVLRSHFPSQMGREHGGGLSLVDDEMFVRLRAVHLGVGRHPLEGEPIAHLLLPEVPAVWQTRLA
jgi:hypothetical protein